MGRCFPSAGEVRSEHIKRASFSFLFICILQAKKKWCCEFEGSCPGAVTLWCSDQILFSSSRSGVALCSTLQHTAVTSDDTIHNPFFVRRLRRWKHNAVRLQWNRGSFDLSQCMIPASLRRLKQHIYCIYIYIYFF